MSTNLGTKEKRTSAILLTESEEAELLRARLQDEFESILSQALKDKERDGLSRADLAKKLGRDEATISRWFTHGSNWRLSSLADLAAALEIVFDVSARSQVFATCYRPDGRYWKGPSHQVSTSADDRRSFLISREPATTTSAPDHKPLEILK